MTAAAGAGAAGAAIFKAMSQAQKPGVFQPHVLSMVLLVPLLVAGLSHVDSFAMAVSVVTLLGGSVTLLAISLQSLVQMAIDDHFRGRVMGLWTTVSIGSGALGAVIMGMLIERVGIAPAQATIGLVLTGLSAVMILRFRKRG
jgi:hypothetical protein